MRYGVALSQIGAPGGVLCRSHRQWETANRELLEPRLDLRDVTYLVSNTARQSVETPKIFLLAFLDISQMYSFCIPRTSLKTLCRRASENKAFIRQKLIKEIKRISLPFDLLFQTLFYNADCLMIDFSRDTPHSLHILASHEIELAHEKLDSKALDSLNPIIFKWFFLGRFYWHATPR